MERTLEWKQGKPCQPSGLVYYVEAWISHKGNAIKFTIAKVTIDGKLWFNLWVDGVMQMPLYETKLEAATRAEEIRHERYPQDSD